MFRSHSNRISTNKKLINNVTSQFDAKSKNLTPILLCVGCFAIYKTIYMTLLQISQMFEKTGIANYNLETNNVIHFNTKVKN